jgi:hypothetical protein
MLKEVEANGQIALGERFAGRRYDLRFHPDGRVELMPVPAAQESSADENRLWAQKNAEAIEQYNRWAIQREPYAQRVRRWRASQTD